VLYTLVDTPGFERARAVREWLLNEGRDALPHERPAVVRKFVQTFSGTGKFTDECELLSPIVEGAGIIYVIDGSVPYDNSYQAEMEILQWTSRPSMALINPHGRENYIEQWREVLGTYFRIVREFNALTAEFVKRMDLLRVMGHLYEPWKPTLDEAVAALEQDRGRRVEESARTIAGMLADMLTFTVSKPVAVDEPPEAHRADLEERFKTRQRALENRCRRRVEEIYEFHTELTLEQASEELDEDLFSEQAWRLFGLTRTQLIAAGVTAGAAIGLAVDAASAGLSLGVGTSLGALGGGALAWWSSQQLAKVKVLSRSLATKELRYGPVKNPNFPFVALNRAIYHHKLLANMTHSRRDPSVAAFPPDFNPLDKAQRKALAEQFAKLQSPPHAAGAREKLASLLVPLLSLRGPGGQ
jgi:hypothetical protein